MKKLFVFFLMFCILFSAAAACAEEDPATAEWIRNVEPVKMSVLDYYGFTLPIYDNNGKIQQHTRDSLPQIEGYASTKNARIDLYYYLYQNDEYYEVPEYARALQQESVAKYQKSFADVQTQEFEIEGHPALAIIGVVRDKEHADDWHGFVNFARNNITGTMYVIIHTNNENAPILTMDNLIRFAQEIRYDPSKAPSTMEDGTFTVTADSEALTAGKKVQMTAAFDKPDLVNKSAKNDGVTWSVIDPETGEAPAGYKMDAKKGVLTAPKDVAAITKVRVVGDSSTYHTTASCDVTVIPAAQSIATDPAELFFYTGTDAPETVKAVLTPDTVPTIGILWALQKEGIVELTPGEDGTATLKPLTAGKVNVNVSEPGGKKATLKVSVVAPVEEVELSLKGKTGPGGTVTVSAALQPKDAGNKNLEWALDVGADIATISEKGQVKISKTAAPGTVITVTCKALGAAVPVEKTIQIEVTEK